MSKKATVDTQIMSEKFSYIDESDTETEEYMLKDYTEKKLSHGDDDKVETEHEDESYQSPKLEDKTETVPEAGPSLPTQPDKRIKDDPKARPSHLFEEEEQTESENESEFENIEGDETKTPLLQKQSANDDDKVEPEHENESSQSPKLADKTETIPEAGPPQSPTKIETEVKAGPSLPPEQDEMVKDEPKAGPSLPLEPDVMINAEPNEGQSQPSNFDEKIETEPTSGPSQSPNLKDKTKTVPETGPSLPPEPDVMINDEPNEGQSNLPNEEVQTNPPEDESFELRKISGEIRKDCDELLRHLLDIQKTGKPNAECIKERCYKLMMHLYKYTDAEMNKIVSECTTVFGVLLHLPYKKMNKLESEWKKIIHKIVEKLHSIVSNFETEAKRIIDKQCIEICIDIKELIDATEIEVEESGTINALFKNQPEETVLMECKKYIKTQTTPSKDSFGYTMLHKAVEKKYLSVAELLIDHGSPLAYGMGGIIPLHIAIYKGFDEMAALIVSKLPRFVVRRMFGDKYAHSGNLVEALAKEKENRNKEIELSGTYDNDTVEPMFTMHQLISKNLDKTILQVLNSYIEKEPDSNVDTIHFKLLDIDDKRMEPSDNKKFNRKARTAFQALAYYGKENAFNHPVLRKYVDYYWECWCRKRYLYNGLMHVVSLFCLTFSVATGVIAPDVCTYDTPLQYSRAAMEVISYLHAIVVLITEIRQMIRKCKAVIDHVGLMHGLFRDSRYLWKVFVYIFHFLDFFSAILIICVLPLRYIHLKAHWYVFALGYFLWAIMIFKYAIVFSQSGVYVEVIKRVLIRDIIPFGFLILTINTIFSGTFLLVLKADESLYTHNDTRY